MSWDSGNIDSSFGAGQMNFSSGSAQMDFSSGNADFSSSGANKDNNYGNGGAQKDSSIRRERPPPTEEDTQKYRSYEWASNRVRYEYNENAVDEFGMAPRDEELEKQLFGESVHEGLDFSKYASIPVHVERGQAPPRIRSFGESSLHPLMKENIKLAHYTTPTPVQTISIPVVTSGKDLMACAQTGSGKTAAFLIPTLSSLFSNAKDLQKPRPAPYELRNYKAEPLILIIAPTRELCSQIFDDCRRFTYRSSLRPCAVYGGADTVGQIRHLERGCDVLVAAPGRLMDFIQRGKIGLNRVKYLILDEADRMLDMGFEAIIRNIIQKNQLNQDRQTLLFSATFPRAIRALARDFLRQDYLFVKIGRVGGIPNSLTQHVMEVEESDKREALVTLLRTQPPTRTLIFVETKRSADSLDQYLYEREFPSTSIHGDRTQMEREDALLAFKRGVCPLLVATAVAARGIDIPNVMHVINYDMPKDMDEYIHRIGRTARQGKTGLATSFYNTGSDMIASELTKLLKECGQTIPECLRMYETDDITFDEDLDDEGVEQPSYAGQEYVPPENTYQPAADWECPSCSIKNFGSRQMCFKCQTTKPDGEGLVSATSGGYGAGSNNDGYGNDSYGNDYSYGDSSGGGGYSGGGRSGGKPGDWNCPECNVSNFGSRQVCFRCSAAKPEGAGGGDGYSGGGYGGGGNRGNSRPGDWDCPDCQKSNYASRSDCFKCGAARPERLGAPPRREVRARREGDWDCPSCSAVNYSNRTECFKCHAAKEEGGGDTGGYDNASSGYQQDFSSSNENTSSWDPSSAASGWSNSNTTSNNAATSGGGGWNAPKPSSTSGDWNASAAPTSGGGWDSTPSVPAPVAQNLGDGFNENPSTPIVTQPQQQPSGGGDWNTPASTANVPSNSGGWSSMPSAPTNDSWNSNKPQEQQKSGGWNEPVKSPLPKVSPVATINTVKPTEPVSMGWGAAPTAGASGW